MPSQRMQRMRLLAFLSVICCSSTTLALPVSSEVPEVAIPLTRISADLLGGDLFLPDILALHIKGLQDKYDQNARNYLKNTGKSLWLEGFNSTQPLEDEADKDTNMNDMEPSSSSEANSTPTPGIRKASASASGSSSASESSASANVLRAGSFYDKAITSGSARPSSSSSSISSTTEKASSVLLSVSASASASISAGSLNGAFGDTGVLTAGLKKRADASPSYGPPASFPPHRVLLPSLAVTAQLPGATKAMPSPNNYQDDTPSTESEDAVPTDEMMDDSDDEEEEEEEATSSVSSSAAAPSMSGMQRASASSRPSMMSGSSSASAASSAKSSLPSGANRAASTASDPLKSNGGGTLWTGPISIGSNKQSFTIDFDTGSADLWVPARRCGTECGTHNRYDSGSSRTYTPDGDPFTITYGDGSTTSGSTLYDDVNIGGMIATQQELAEVDHASQTFAAEPEDGILGMAFQTISQMNAAPYFQTAVQQKSTKSPIFAFRLADEGGELYLGGVNKQKFSGSIQYHRLNSDAYWQIPGQALVNGNVAVKNSFIMDTGSSLIIAPPYEAQQWWSQVPGSQPVAGADGYYSYPCDSPPAVAFSFGGRAWKISPQKFSLGRLEDGSDQCVGSIVGVDLQIPVWILGDAFLTSVYSIYDVGTNKLGLALPK